MEIIISNHTFFIFIFNFYFLKLSNLLCFDRNFTNKLNGPGIIVLPMNYDID